MSDGVTDFRPFLFQLFFIPGNQNVERCAAAKCCFEFLLTFSESDARSPGGCVRGGQRAMSLFPRRQ